ncbi:LysR family transcriptional regulator [Aureimonas populi]|uniref:LysR family transcriptional regulator n=1 Tax=Aureimonas populi TaxID=1701758 RepID=A0ABW5CLE5_9HYPH|nr:LysR family transcriptional regulator [Aureimonas populi]
MNLTLRQLRAFVEVARLQSFTLAARNLNLTQSAVSMLVRQLEIESGVALFHRVQRSAQLTEIGQQMLPVAERILEDLRRFGEGVDDIRMLKRGTLRLAVPQILACCWLPGIVADFSADHPHIGVHVVDTTGDQIIAAVEDNEAEIGIGPQRAAPDPTIEAQPLFEVPIQIVVPDRGGQDPRGSVSWEEVLDANWIHYSDDFSVYIERTILNDMSLHMKRSSNVRYLSTALAFVGRGMGITAAPSYADVFRQHFKVRFVPIENRPILRKFYLYRRRNHHLSPAAETFIELMRARIAASPSRRF